MERLGAIVQTLILIDASELGERHGDIRVLRAEELAPKTERLFEGPAGRRVVPLVREDDAKVVERLRHADVFRAERLPPGRERLLEQLLGLVERRQPTIGPPHHRQHLRLQFGLPGQLLLDLLGAHRGARGGSSAPIVPDWYTDRRSSAVP